MLWFTAELRKLFSVCSIISGWLCDLWHSPLKTAVKGIIKKVQAKHSILRRKFGIDILNSMRYNTYITDDKLRRAKE